MSAGPRIHPADSPGALVQYSLEQGLAALRNVTEAHRQALGQFLTPPAIAGFMARQPGPIKDGARILDPAAGSAVLACALIAQAVRDGGCHELTVDCFEIDPLLCAAAHRSLEAATAFAARHGLRLHAHVFEADFVLAYCAAARPGLFDHERRGESPLAGSYDYIIANPPYFKLNSNDPRARATARSVPGNTNIYTLFMALAARLLNTHGKAVFIIPRSFCSGAYFSRFRQDLLRQILPTAVHVFESRSSAFQADDVLQENVIFSFRKRLNTVHAADRSTGMDSEEGPSSAHLPDMFHQSHGHTVLISHSSRSTDLLSVRQRAVDFRLFVHQHGGELFLRLPVSELDEAIIGVVDRWTGSLAGYDLQISTGPVVPFRARPLLTDDQAVERGEAAPLLWMQHVQAQRVEWPIRRRQKPQGLRLTEQAQPLLVPNQNYVLLRRFSAKEEARRLVAAPLLAKQFPGRWLGLENHLNYIYSKRRQLGEAEVVGLAALLNSAFLDRFFRIANGTTQVNAAELRALPLPPLEVIEQIGRALMARQTGDILPDIDSVVFDMLREHDTALADLPTIKETRLQMGKIQEAQEILRALGLPKAQQNEIAALTLLVLAQLSEETAWADAKRQSLGIHDMMAGMATRYDRKYAENTRESVRRQVIHQFEQAGIVVRNPDEPTLATNSPRTHYALSDETIRTIRAYGSENWESAVASFLSNKGALLDLYQRQRDQHKIPLVLESGEEYHLSPGKHNQLQAAIIEEFGPRFAPGARVLYLGDTAQKTLVLDKAGFETLGIPIPSHDKLPDVVLYDEQRNWLYLIEAVTSHGPVSPKRRVELEEMLRGCSAGRVYVSAFADFSTFKSYLSEIAWETEVWLAELPSHLIHFNGDRFMGPRG